MDSSIHYDLEDLPTSQADQILEDLDRLATKTGATVLREKVAKFKEEVLDERKVTAALFEEEVQEESQEEIQDMNEDEPSFNTIDHDDADLGLTTSEELFLDTTPTGEDPFASRTIIGGYWTCKICGEVDNFGDDQACVGCCTARDYDPFALSGGMSDEDARSAGMGGEDPFTTSEPEKKVEKRPRKGIVQFSVQRALVGKTRNGAQAATVQI